MASAFVSCTPSAFCVRKSLPSASCNTRRRSNSVRMDVDSQNSASTGVDMSKESKRAIRRRIIGSEGFHRNGFREQKEVVAEQMKSYYEAETMKQLRENNNELQRGGITWRIAKAYGFCWGVERSVSQAFEAMKKYPDRKIYLTNEIIHNPVVNEQMAAGGIEFVPENGLDKDYSKVTKDDVVVLPAFGAKLEDMIYLNENAHEIVDTTCPWVSKVWKQMDQHQIKNVTSIVHGKYSHEETVATISFGDRYLVVKNMEQTEYVCSYIENGGDREEFLEKFKGAYSEGFDPDKDLRAVGIANQTTMLKSETAAVAKRFELAMMRIHDSETFKESFIAADTICDATQDRQDAMIELLETPLDLMIVVGGFNSSNTHHLQEMAEHKGIQSYWVDRADRVTPDNRIWARTADGVERMVDNFLPARPITIGLTSGASTPDQNVEVLMERINEAHANACK